MLLRPRLWTVAAQRVPHCARLWHAALIRTLFLAGLRIQVRADAVQEIIARLLVAIRERRLDPAKVEPWCSAVARHVRADIYRSHLRTSASLDAADMPAGTPSPDESHMARERASAVRGAVARLPREWRDPLLLQARGLSYAEIAHHLGLTTNAVGLRLMRARRWLRAQLSETVLP